MIDNDIIYNSMKYSFIIPHKNSPDLLDRCVASIPKSDDVQIVVVDDNSDEDKKPHLDRKGVEVVLLDADHSKGAGRARNVGIKHAKGRWLLFIDADDTYSAHISTFLEKYEDANTDVVFFGSTHITNEKEDVRLPPQCEGINEEQLFTLKFWLTEPWNKMVKREFIEHHQIHFEECPVGNDIFYTYQVGYYSGNNYAVYSEPVYNYYINDGSIVHKKKNSEAYYVTICKHVYQCNAFRKFIGYKRRNRNILVKFAAIWVKKGFNQFLFALQVYIRHFREIKRDANLYVDYFTHNG